MIFSKSKIFAISGAVLGGILLVFAGFWYVSGLQSDLQQSQTNNERLRDSIEEQQQLVDQMQEDFSEIRRINSELREETQRQQQTISNLNERFNVDARGERRDFAAIAAERPGLVERLVNRGTRNAFRCLELASGAEHTEEELEATTSSEINQECPRIANPNYEPTL